MNFDIYDVLTQIAKDRPIFHNERDFQFSLAWKIKEIYGYSIRLEYCFPEMEMGKRSYVDLVVSDDNSCILFELKYKTRKSDFLNVNSEDYHLQEQGARDLGCYFVLNDLLRIEKQLDMGNSINGKQIVAVYSILLTNDEKYKTGFKENSLCSNFGFIEGKRFFANQPISFIIPKGKTKEDTCVKNRCEFSFQRDYTVNWETYSQFLSLLILKAEQ